MMYQGKVIVEDIEAEQDDHVCVIVRVKDRPTLSLDIMNSHGRRVLSVRVNGMVVSSQMIDIGELPPHSPGDLERYCGFCGEKLNLFSSKGHRCSDAKV